MTHTSWSSAAGRILSPPQPDNVFGLIDEAFRGREDSLCLTDISDPDNVRTYTWRSLRGQAMQIANAYRQLGLQKGDGSFLLTRKSMPTIAAQLASFAGGTLFVPGQVLTRDSNEAHKVSILKDILSKRSTLINGGVLKDGGLLVIDPDLEPFLDDMVRSHFRQVLTLGHDGEGTLAELASQQPATLSEAVTFHPDDFTYSVFTSGTSTGVGKCVCYTQEMIALSLKILGDWLIIAPGETALNPLPINHIHGLMQQLLAVLASGGHVVMMERFDPERFARAIKGVDIVSGVPAIWNQTLDYLATLEPDEARKICRSTRVFTAGSDRISARLRRRFYDITGKRLVVRGGSTEQGHSYGNSLTHPNMGEGVGSPFPTYQMSLRDPNNPQEEVEMGVIGELWMRGPCVVTKYIGNPEATAKAFPGDGWYRSGDLFRRTSSSDELTFVGRIADDLDRSFIKSGGERVAPAEIERFFSNVREFQDLRIVGLDEEKADAVGLIPPDARRGYGARIAAVVIVNKDTDLEQAKTAFTEACRDIPSAYLRPRVVAFVESFSTSGDARGSTLGKVNPLLIARDLEDQGRLPTLRSIHAVTYGDKPPALTDLVVCQPPGAGVAQGQGLQHPAA